MTLYTNWNHSIRRYFNSHPHEEDDRCIEHFEMSEDISTHILTKRMTPFKKIFRHWTDISTHILTKRMTVLEVVASWEKGISTHILTKRMTFKQYFVYSYCLYFNSHPHEEDDGYLSDENYIYDISTHILTKRMTFCCNNCSCNHILFQLTSSRRGWLKRPLRKCLRKYFNSHPHEEDDNMH